ncbi:MAG: hypothetical protein NTY53_22490 [Kiritimatiellaeota bacterium]|nr:hypothetical protein [Kiritimatiellota bacterium]
MNKIWLVVMLGLSAAAAEPTAYPFQLALASPVALIAPEHSISGLRLNLLWGANENVNGMDLGLVNYTAQNHRGLQLGLVNLVGGDLTGFNMGLVNWAGGKVAGSEVGLINWAGGEVSGTQDAFLLNVSRSKVSYQFSLVASWAEEVEDGQFACFNRATKMTGLQMGVINLTGELHGLQIGLLNIASEKPGFWKVLPLVNACW